MPGDRESLRKDKYMARAVNVKSMQVCSICMCENELSKCLQLNRLLYYIKKRKSNF